MSAFKEFVCDSVANKELLKVFEQGSEIDREIKKFCEG